MTFDEVYVIRTRDGSIKLNSLYGQWKFHNEIKLIKFQMKCPHPSTFRYMQKDRVEKICSRCAKRLGFEK